MRSDLTGQRFGRLVVETGVSIKRSGKTRMLWTCLCDCGTRLTVISDNLKSGHTKSCGCLRIETGREVGKKVKHGASHTPEYRVHNDMVLRTTSPKHHAFAEYGAVGRTVCTYLRDFTNFFSLLGKRPSDEHEIDRTKNSGGYWCGSCAECLRNSWPFNIRWATRSEQRQNMDDIRFLTIRSKTLCIADWEQEAGLKPDRIRARIKAGWPIDESLLQPPKYNSTATGR